MAMILPVELGQNSYEIRIEKGSLSDAGIYIRQAVKGHRIHVLTDSNVGPLYASRVIRSLETAGFIVSLQTMEAGEITKNLNSLATVWTALVAAGLTREDTLVALGGGVIGDLGGFAAATYLRGISYVQIPTSLLAQVDSSVGGKVAVDLPEGKNLAGAFWQPKLVLIDPDVLYTLPDEFFSDGMGEVIKYGMIRSKSLYEKLYAAGGRRNISLITEDVIYECLDIKRDLVERDERDTADRMLLNFGHTLGHAIEVAQHFNGLNHGHAVGIGMLLMTRISEAMGFTAPGTSQKIAETLRMYGLPTDTEAAHSPKMLQAISKDKKNLGSTLNIILISEIGRSFIYPTTQQALTEQYNESCAMTPVKLIPSHLSGDICVPPSKSLAHRMIICAALADGKSRVYPIQQSEDVLATLGGIAALGAGYSIDGDTVEITGIGARRKTGPVNIECRESGSTLRFLFPLSLTVGVGAHLTGAPRLAERPLDVYRDVCARRGISYRHSALPELSAEIRGTLTPGVYSIPGNISSQFVTGLLLALSVLPGDSDIRLTTRLESTAYVDLTIDAMKLFGVTVEKTVNGYHIPGGQQYKARDIKVEGDYSQAANFLCAAALGNDITVGGLDPESCQGDRGLITILERMGADVVYDNDRFIIKAGNLHAVEADVSNIPDTAPVLGVVCALSQGTSVLKNAGRLRIKECDRLSATVDMINRLGGSAEETDDTIIIHGVSAFKGGCECPCCNDHRMAMAYAVAATRCEEPVILDDRRCVRKSFPNFFEEYTALGGACE